MIGRSILHYRITARLGEGGMGEVWLAEDTKLGRKVALKILPPDLAASPVRRTRFEREARAIAALNHPNIVTIHSVEQAEGLHFIIMELVEGQPLSRVIPKEGLPPARLLDIGIAIASALAAAHKQGITHRDLKPDNVMVGGDGRVKVLDFGLAKLREDETRLPETTHLPTAPVTQEGHILGTVAYMSPEQAEGKPVDFRSDVFSFGIMLYEMATGRRPFAGDTPISTITSILRDNPPAITDLQAALPRHLERIVRRCLAKEPDRRYQSTADLRNELEGLKDELTSGDWRPSTSSVSGEVARPIPAAPAPRRSRRIILAAGTVAALALVALAAWMIQRQGASGGASRGGAGPFAAVEMKRITTSGQAIQAALSPDGRYVAYTHRSGELTGMRVRQVTTGDEVTILPPGSDTLSSLAYSHEGDFIYYTARDQGKHSLYRISSLGGIPMRLIEGVGAGRPSPDGLRIAFERYVVDGAVSTLEVAREDGSEAKSMAQRTGRDHFDSPPEWSPDGKVVAAIAHSFADLDRNSIIVIDVDTGETRPVPMDPLRSVSDLAWLPPGQGLVVTGTRSAVPWFARNQLWHVDLETGAVRGITNELSSYSGVSRSADGSRLVTIQEETTAGIDVGPADGGLETFSILVAESTAADGLMGMSWLPGDRLAHTTTSEGRVRIRLSSTSGGPALPLTPADMSCLSPQLEAGGGSLLAACLKERHVNLWRFHLDGRQNERLTEGTLDHTPNPLPDGSVVYITFTDQGGSLVRLRPGGASPERLAGPGVLFGMASPDGAHVFYVALGDDERYHPRLLPLSGGEPRELDYSAPLAPGPDDDLAWTPDAKGLSWLSEEGQDTVFRVYDVATGAVRELNRFAGRRYDGHAWSPDGKRLALVRVTRTGHVVMVTDTSRGTSGGSARN